MDSIPFFWFSEIALSSLTARCHRFKYSGRTFGKFAAAIVSLGKQNPISISVLSTLKGINRMNQRQSHVALICNDGKRFMKAVLFVNAGNGFWIPSKSDGRGTIDRLDGTNTASQLPICSPTGFAFIGLDFSCAQLKCGTFRKCSPLNISSCNQQHNSAV